MKTIYLDANIFIYLSDPKSPYYSSCQKLITYLKEKEVSLITSAETIQEVIHWSKNFKILDKGLKISYLIIKLVNELLPVNESVILAYLKLAKKYPLITSRDLIHAVSAVDRKIPFVVSYDREFKQIDEVKSFKPEDLV